MLLLGGRAGQAGLSPVGGGTSSVSDDSRHSLPHKAVQRTRRCGSTTVGPLGSLGMRAPRVPPQLAVLVVSWLGEPPSLQGRHSGAT